MWAVVIAELVTTISTCRNAVAAPLGPAVWAVGIARRVTAMISTYLRVGAALQERAVLVVVIARFGELSMSECLKP